MPILVLMVAVLGVLFLVVSRKKKEGPSGNWVQFYNKGREAGFSIKETEMLRQLAIQCSLEDPITLFESQAQLDKCIHSLVRNIKMSGAGDDEGTQVFLSKMYDFRQTVEMHTIHQEHSITNSRQMNEGQMLRVLVTGTGVFKSQVVKNTNQYMTISRPVSAKGDSASMQWAGLKIAVYFWREDDAGYVFDSMVEDEVFSLGIPSIKISHGDSLFRTQKRQSVRVKMRKAAFLYLVPPDEPSHQIEPYPGLKCLLDDISDTGCAVVVGGRADSNIRVKVQFAMDDSAVCMTGTVRSTAYREEIDRSVLHIEAEPLPAGIRNHILGGVFGMLPDEDEDELPFRILDEEMASLTASDNIPESELDLEEQKGSNAMLAGMPDSAPASFPVPSATPLRMMT